MTVFFLSAGPVCGNSADSYKLGLELKQHQRTGDAIKAFTKAIAEDPNNFDAYVQRIQLYCSINMAARALEDCNKVIAMDPSHRRFPRIYEYRSLAYKQLDDPEKTMEDCQKALSMPDGGDREGLTHTHLYASENLGKADLAMADLNEILLKYSPRSNTAFVYQARAELYEGRKEYTKAEADMKAAIKLKPAFDRLYLSLARLHERMNKNQDAIDDLTRDIALNKLDEAAYYERGRLRLKTGNYADALSDLNQSVKLAPDMSAKIYEVRAETLDKLGKKDLAAADRARAAKMRDVTNF